MCTWIKLAMVWGRIWECIQPAGKSYIWNVVRTRRCVQIYFHSRRTTLQNGVQSAAHVRSIRTAIRRRMYT